MEGNTFRFKRTWSFLVRFLCPITLTIILLNKLWQVIMG
jgi:SNF family Na+-dependent transporter